MGAVVSLASLCGAIGRSVSQDPVVGPQAFVEDVVQIDVEGNTRWTEEQIISELGHPVGGPFNPLNIELWEEYPRGLY